MSAALTAPGTISASGKYHLANPITVNGGYAFTVSGASTIEVNLNGFQILDASTGNAMSAAFYAPDPSYTNLVILGGSIKGFRHGVQSAMPYTRVQEVDFSGNKYIGANLQGSVSRAILCVADGIGGVTDEAYAIVINMTGADGFIEGGEFRNIYRQAGASSSLVGEGCPINAQGAGITIRRNFLENDTGADKTIAIFTGASGGQIIERNDTYNFKVALQDALAGGSITVRRNTFVLPAAVGGSKAIWAEAGLASKNTLIGYETPISGGITDDQTNTVYP